MLGEECLEDAYYFEVEFYKRLPKHLELNDKKKAKLYLKTVVQCYFMNIQSMRTSVLLSTITIV